MALNAFCFCYAKCLLSDAIRQHVATAMVSAYNSLLLPSLEVITYKCLFIFQIIDLDIEKVLPYATLLKR